MENATKPLLTILLLGHKTALNNDARLLLAQWITLKTMIADANVPDDTVLNNGDRHAFRVNRTMPDNVSIWIGLTKGEYWATRFQRHAATLGTRPDIAPAMHGKNTQVIMWGVNKLVILAIIDRGDIGLAVNPRHYPRLFTLWPDAKADIEWPPEVMSDVEATRLASGFEDFLRSQKVRWVPSPTV